MVETEFLSKDLDQGLSLVSEAVNHPVFPDAEVVKILGQRRDDIKSLKDHPAQAMWPYARAPFFFGAGAPFTAGLSMRSRSAELLIFPHFLNTTSASMWVRISWFAILGDNFSEAAFFFFYFFKCRAGGR